MAWRQAMTKKTGEWVGGDRIEDVVIFIGSDKDGKD